MLSIVFSSRNGSSTLPLMLEGFLRLEPVEAGMEIIAVDNSSDDDTPRILKSFQKSLPITVLHEPNPGKNRALNRALDVVRGRLIVFTDDDVIPEPDWLTKLQKASMAHPNYDVFGGAIRPYWPAPPPAWIQDYGVPLGATYAITERSSGPAPAAYVWGPNMAVRRSIFEAGHRFSIGIGPDGRTNYGMGSETEFLLRIEKLGMKAWFVQEAIVHHMIKKEHMTEAWVLQRSFRHGVGYAQLHASSLKERGLSPRQPLFKFRRIIYAAATWLVRALPPSRTRFHILHRGLWLSGIAAGFRVSHSTAPGNH